MKHCICIRASPLHGYAGKQTSAARLDFQLSITPSTHALTLRACRRLHPGLEPAQAASTLLHGPGCRGSHHAAHRLPVGREDTRCAADLLLATI